MKKRKTAHITTPTVLQMEATECGAAALNIIFGYFGLFIPLAELREACGVSRDGSRAVAMLEVAREYGFNTKAVNLAEWEAVFTYPLPVIVFWQFNHFIVIEGIQNNKVYINDPAFGRRTISTQVFNEGFTGVVLILTPKKSFKPHGSPPYVLGIIKNKISPFKRALSAIAISSGLLMIIGLIIPGFTAFFIDDILIKHMHHWLIPLLIGIAMTAILRGLCTGLQKRFLARFNIKLLVASQTQLFWHVLRLPLQFFTQRYSGDIAERLSANDRIAQLLSSEVSANLINIFAMVFFFVLMFIVSWPLAVFGLAMALINSGILVAFTRAIANKSYQFIQQRGQLMGIETDALQRIESIKAQGMENHFFTQWSGRHALTLNLQQDLALYDAGLSLFQTLFNLLSTAVFLSLGSYFIMQGKLTLGGLVAMQSLLVSFQEPVKTLLDLGSNLPEIKGDLFRVNDLLLHPEDNRFRQHSKLANQQGTTPKSELTGLGSIKINNISFGYSHREPPILVDFSLNLIPGSRVAIVGATGCGKSTVAKLLAGLYTPWTGNICLETTNAAGKIRRQDLSALSPVALNQLITLVDNDLFLFEGSIEDNITLFNPSYSETACQEAIESVCLTDLLRPRQGMAACVMENGRNFSGGQAQRIELARAFLRRTPVIILDEATSALDLELEKKIMAELKALSSTIVIISHRLLELEDCQEIIVLDKGRVIERGTQQVLLERQGHYAELYRSLN